MTRYILRRLVNLLLVLFGLTLFTFILLHLAPGSPVYLLVGEGATTQDIRELERKLGLDRPLPEQYADYVIHISQGDLGRSIVFSQPALPLILQRLPSTLELTVLATLLTVVVSIPIGVVMALKPRSLYDYAGTLVALFGVSMPSFWFGIMLIIVAAVQLGWLASSGRGPFLAEGIAGLLSGNPQRLWESLRFILLPTVTLSSFQLAFLSRLTRSSLLEELGQNYVRAARARGLPRLLVIGKHALRNALMPVVTVLGLEIGTLIGGAIIVETVFAWPGVGQLVYQSISGRDYPLAQACILVIGSFVVSLTLVVDLAYLLIDPRVRLA